MLKKYWNKEENILKSKIYRYRFNIIAFLFILIGSIAVVTNSIELIRFEYKSKTLDELNIGNLHSGIYVKDNLSYTYGNIGEYEGIKKTEIYLVDIGSEHNQYMEMLAEKSSFYKNDNDIEGLHTYFPGRYSELNTSKNVKLYAIIEKKNVAFYDFYKELFSDKSDDLKNIIPKDYRIRVVNPENYKKSRIIGACMIFVGVIVCFYVYLSNRKKMKDIEVIKEDTGESEPIGLFSRGLLEDRKILCVELTWESEIIVFKEKNLIEHIISALDDVVDDSDDFISSEGNALCTFIFKLEDCTDIIFEMWDEKKIKSVGGFYYISEDSYNYLIDIWKGNV